MSEGGEKRRGFNAEGAESAEGERNAKVSKALEVKM